MQWIKLDWDNPDTWPRDVDADEFGDIVFVCFNGGTRLYPLTGVVLEDALFLRDEEQATHWARTGFTKPEVTKNE